LRAPHLRVRPGAFAFPPAMRACGMRFSHARPCLGSILLFADRLSRRAML
jgi:hypothetical protein